MTVHPPDRRTVVAGLIASPLVAKPALAAREPTRVVCLDYSMAETLVAMGRPPLAVVDRDGYRTWVREPVLPPEVLDLGSRFEPNLELMAALRPDLIFTIPYLAPLDPIVERIAPIRSFDIYNADGRALERAGEATLEAAEAIGDRNRGKRLVAEVELAFERCRRRIAAAPPPPVCLVTLLDARHARVYGRMGLFEQVMDRIGVENAWTGETSFWGFSTVGLEALAEVGEAQMIFVKPLPDDLAPDAFDGPLWRHMPAFAGRPPLLMEPALMFGALPSARRFSELLSGLLLDGETG